MSIGTSNVAASSSVSDKSVKKFDFDKFIMNPLTSLGETLDA